MNNMLLKKDLSTEQLAIVQSELDKKKKSKTVMYLAWWFTGGIGGHRYYLGDTKKAMAMTFTLGGLGFWALLDVFKIGKRLEEKTEILEAEIINKVKSLDGSEISEIKESITSNNKPNKNKLPAAFVVIAALIIFGVILGVSSNKTAPVSSTVASVSSNAAETVNEKVDIISEKVDKEITKENYEKIKAGMTKQEVIDILGEPDMVSESELAGLGKSEMFHYQKGFTMKAIDVFISNGKVSSKNWTDL